MSRSRARLGVSSCLMHKDAQRPIFKGKALQFTEEKLALALWRAGATPLGLLDLKSDAAAREQLGQVDGLVLQGGADVAPESYGQTPLRPEWAGDRERDVHELRLVAVARELGKPILGVCRGVQLLNVALGGSLFQDIETQVTGALVHRDWHRYEQLEHEVVLAPDSWLARVHQADRLLVNTVHHQALDRVSPELVPTAWAADGIVEAAEAIDERSWMVGIQWHPEWLDGSAEGGTHRTRGDRVFEAFARICRERA